MKLLLTLILALPFFALADGHKKEEKMKLFSDHKSTYIKRLDERVAKLQEHKVCIERASDHKAMKECRMKHKEWRKGFKAKSKAMREEFRKKRQEMRGK